MRRKYRSEKAEKMEMAEKAEMAECFDLLALILLLWFDLLDSSLCYSSPTAAQQPGRKQIISLRLCVFARENERDRLRIWQETSPQRSNRSSATRQKRI
jgi:hypothetical protein